jgi:integral membrane protein (TIGR00529 family)
VLDVAGAMAVPALIKVLGCFVLILTLNRLRLHLSLCLLTGALVLGLWMSVSPAGIVRSLISSMTSTQTINLAAIICLILMVSQMMKVSGQLDRIVSNFATIVHDARTVGAVMPALIGLLPMPGGALFSAPMVETAVAGWSLSGDRKTAVNYWFRHIWEYWWPLYPGVVLAVSLLQVEMWRFIVIQAPLTLISVAAGTYFLLRPLKNNTTVASYPAFRLRMLGPFMWEIMPILVVVASIVLIALVRKVLSLTGMDIKLPEALPLHLGLLSCLGWVMVVNRLGFRHFRESLLNRGTLLMLLLVFGIMAFKGILVDSRAVIQIRDEMVRYRIPLLVVTMTMPFISGLITGIAIGFVGASFPLIVPLFVGMAPLDFLAHASLAYAFGYMGMMLSPVHICFLVSKDYFQASLAASYRLIIKPAVAVMTIWMMVLGLFFLFQ